MKDSGFTRRQMLGAGAAVGTGLLIAGCSSPESKVPPGSEGAMPAYVPILAAEPERPAPDEAGLPLYFDYPSSPKKFNSQPPGDGSTVSAFVNLNGAVLPRPLAKNAVWQAVNERLNATLDFHSVITQYFTPKLQALIAGGDLPDIVQLERVPQMDRMLESLFTDLTPYLAGDAIKEYPALANIPTLSWRNASYGGKLFGVPNARPGVSSNSSTLIRLDILEDLGLPTKVDTYEEFRAVCLELTDPRASKWAIPNGEWMLQIIPGMCGVPNQWKEENGRFTSMYETEEMRLAVATAADLWKAGVIHPDGFSGSVPSADLFVNGTTPVMPGVNYGNVYSYDTAFGSVNPNMKLGLWGPVAVSGASPKYWLNQGAWLIAGIKKSTESRVRMLLSMFNSLASPFGTEEWLANSYGVKDVTYSLENGQPRPITVDRELHAPIASIVTAPQVLYRAGQRYATEVAYEFQARWLTEESKSYLPTVGLSSDTDLREGVQLKTVITDAQRQVVLGRKSIADWDAAVRDWKRKGGDKIRNEYQESYQSAHS